MTLEQAQQHFGDGLIAPFTIPIHGEPLRALADTIPQIVWSARADGFWDYHNARWYEFTGFPRGEGGDESWKPLLHPDDVEPAVESWYQAVRTGEPYETEYRLRDRGTGEYRWHLSRALPIKTSTGRVIRWYGTCTDIHDYREALCALHQVDRRKDEFLAMLAHELRNPLASIVSAVDLLDTDESEERMWATSVIARQAAQLTRLIDDLLDVARINSGKICLNKEPLDLAMVLDRAVETSRLAINGKQHKLTTDYPRGELILHGDPVRLEQLVVNLLANAAKYTPPGGHLSLRARRHDKQLSVVIADDGLGIPAKNLPEIFRLFAQGEWAGGSTKDGLGLGLTIVQKVAELHGGSVSATSEGESLGSAFTVQLPAIETSAKTPDRPQAVSPSRLPSPVRILIVDDHADSADGLARLLRRCGHQVKVAYDGPSALAITPKFRPEVCLLDLDLPEMDGCQIASRLRQDSHHRGALLIALTGYGQEEDRKRSTDAGFDHHVLKPVDLEEVQRCIAGHLAAPDRESAQQAEVYTTTPGNCTSMAEMPA